MTEPRHTVTLTVTVNFEGDYYGPEELVGACDGWIGSAFNDRDNLTGYSLTGTVTAEHTDAEPEPDAVIEWTGENIDAVMAFMAPDAPIHVNSLSELRFTNADELVGVNTPDGLVVARIGDSIARVGDHLTVRPRTAEPETAEA
jgi:hypothetical protein